MIYKIHLKLGNIMIWWGKFKRVTNRLEVINPIVGVKLAKENEIVPKYSLKGDLTDKILIKLYEPLGANNYKR